MHLPGHFFGTGYQSLGSERENVFENNAEVVRNRFLPRIL